MWLSYQPPKFPVACRDGEESERFFNNKKKRITYLKVLDKNRLDLMASRLRIR